MKLKLCALTTALILLQTLPVTAGNFTEKELALFRATVQGDVEGVKAALKNGVSPNTHEPGHGRTALHEAALNGKDEIAKVLIAKKADVNAKDKAGSTPMHSAVVRANVGALEILIQAKANVSAANNQKNTPLHFASQRGGDPEVVKILIAAKANVNARGIDGRTPLHSAAHSGNTEVVKLLIEAKSKINAKTDIDGTPLLLAALAGNTEIVNLLLEAKADPKIKDKGGKTALDYAKEGNFPAIVEALKAAGAK